MSVDEGTSQIAEMLARSGAPRELPGDVLVEIAQRFHPLDVTGGTVICRQGEPADSLYVVEQVASPSNRWSTVGRSRWPNVAPGR